MDTCNAPAVPSDNRNYLISNGLSELAIFGIQTAAFWGHADLGWPGSVNERSVDACRDQLGKGARGL
jgi:hypothetical protein